MIKWDKGELRLLREIWADYSLAEVTAALNAAFRNRRTPRAVQVMASREGLTAPPTIPAEDEDLIVALLEERIQAEKLVKILTDSAIAKKFECSPGTVKKIRMSMED